MEPLRDRMPLILAPKDFERCLAPFDLRTCLSICSSSSREG
jgi:hypothetical protein